MKTYQKNLLALFILIILAVGAWLYIYKKPLPVETQSRTATTTTETVSTNGVCGLSITSHNPNDKASLIKPITITGVIDNTNRETLGCSWILFEGQLGSAHVFALINNEWKSISKETPVPVLNWMTDKTTFSVEIAIDTGVINIAEGTPLKVVFTEENPAAINPSKTYTLPLVTAYGELNNNPELMSLTVYIQDKAALAADRCDATKAVVYKVSKTTAVADTSLKLLFKDELANYGIYSSVSIENTVAKVQLTHNNLPSGRPYSSLSSCEIGHLTSVLTDTLTQYDSIKSVQLYSPTGKIEF